ncbi:hypothetical protein BOX15_Mlig021115g3 [Macrostomum lignano]|uniref:FHF complex subunit HOOK-interacting protein C-terminal domain-containing protein n=1 Tax=Macrostomum lignano TaxID=282301 RepID=A0A267DGY5_9PLAT|nr:hypothetical protein BOX15_Mlig021115g3 [Macrostomum lignano]
MTDVQQSADTGSGGGQPQLRSGIEARLLPDRVGLDSHNRDISPATRSRRGRSATDPDTRLEVFENHWDQVRQVMDATQGRAITGDDVEPVVHYVDQMLSLLIEERPPAAAAGEAASAGQQPGQILACAERERVFDLLLAWSNRATGECLERLKLEQLKQYELLIGQCRQSVVGRVQVLRPLLRLVKSCCSAGSSRAVESRVVLILHQLCVVLNRSPNLLDTCLEVGRAEAGSQFLVFSLLVPYVHREASIGQHARDALLLVMALSARNQEVGRFIAFSSDFCPVLATGLSGLYSSLPRRLPVDSDDWCQLTPADWQRIPDLAQFLNSLDFCNVVVELAHPLVRDQLLHFIYSGFLKPVLGAALHQSSMDEVTAATAYLELFLRRVTEPALLKVLVRFVLLDYYDDYNILESLIGRIKFSNSLLGVVTMSLFRTLLNLHIEDVHYQLLYRYLIPCQHLMLSQRRCLRDNEPYARAADKFASLVPSCCVQDTGEEAISPAADRLRAYESPHAEYLRDAAERIVERTVASRRWAFRYDGVDPPIDVFEGAAGDAALAEAAAAVAAAGLSSVPLTEIQSAFRRLQGPTAAVAVAATEIADEADATSLDADYYDELNSSASRLFDASSSGDGPATDRRSSASSLVNSSLQQKQQKQQQKLQQSLAGPSSVAAASRPYKDSAAHVQSMYTLSFLDPDSGLDSSAGAAASASASTAAAVSATKPAAVVEEDGPAETDAAEDNNSHADNMDGNDAANGADDSRAAADLRAFISQSLDQLEDLNGFLTLLDSLPPSLVGGNDCADSGIDASVQSLEAALSEAGLLLAAEGGSPRPPLRQTSNMSAAGLSDSGRFDETSSSTAATPSASIGGGALSTSNHPLAASAAAAAATNSSMLLPMPQQPGLEFLPVPPRPHPSARPPANNFYTIGPFLTALLDKVETMPANSLYVNLLLTNLLSDLACYPQPLLKSLLLNAGLVLQPQVKSLYQALNVVKHRVDCFSYTMDNFDSLLLDARRFLYWRVNRSSPEEFELQHFAAMPVGSNNNNNNNRSDSLIALPGDRRRAATSASSAASGSLADWSSFHPHQQQQQQQQPEAVKKKSFFESLFSSSKSNNSGGSGKENRKLSSGSSTATGSRDRLDGLKTRNMVYAAVVLEEFTKELSAICREHSVRPL